MIAVALVLGLAGYACLWHDRAKPDHGHDSPTESRPLIGAEKIASAGWTHAETAYEALVEQADTAAPVHSVQITTDGVEELRGLAADGWHLPIEYTAIAAPSHAAAGEDCAVHFQAVLEPGRTHIVGFDVYRKAADIVVLPRWETYPEELVPRRLSGYGRITIPATALPPGTYRVTFPALKQSSQWELVVDGTGS
jgi:hypothetical protein